MAQKKDYRSDNTYIISQDSTDNPKLGAKVLSDGRESLFLDYYFGTGKIYDDEKDCFVVRKDRKRQYLKLYLWRAPRNPMERQQNKETLELAKKIRFERGQQILNDGRGYRLKTEQKVYFLDYYQTYLDNYTKKDKAMVRLSYNRFRDFLRDTPEYNKYCKGLRPQQVDKDMVEAFTDYLQIKSKGEGAHSIYSRFRKVVRYAIEHNIMANDPCKGVKIIVDDKALVKAILSTNEIQQLVTTHYNRENPNIRRAFIFCLYCGLRFCDVRDLTFANVDYSNKLLRFEQNKTKGHSKSSSVVIPLNDGLLRLIGEPTSPDKKDDLIFNLPTYDTCREALQNWVRKAGINKHITWHCARHSFATNILNAGANIKVVSSLLGHSSLTYTTRYTHAVNEMKRQAIDSLPELKI